MSNREEDREDVYGDEPERSDEREEVAERQSSETRQIIEMGGVTPAKGRHTIHCLSIVGQVEGHYILPPQNKTTKYEHVIPQLVAIQEDPDIEGLIMILNTVGGDVEAGLAIAELIASMNKPTVSLVLGGGHSIGVPLAVSARKSFIVPSATMTIHPVRMNGVVLGVPQTLSYFDKMQERITRFVEENSGMETDDFRRLMMNTGELVMDVGTVLDGEQAVEEGLIDYLGGLHDAIECLYDMIDEEQSKRKRHQPNSRSRTSYQPARNSEAAPVRRRERQESPYRYPARKRQAAASADVPGVVPDVWSRAYGTVRGEARMGSQTGRERQNTPPKLHPATEGNIGQPNPHSYNRRDKG